jgi:hypothetical protein
MDPLVSMAEGTAPAVAQGPLRVYSEFTEDGQSSHAEINPILAVTRSGDASPAAPFRQVWDPEECDLFVFPYDWSHYVFRRRVSEARDLAEKAASHGKRIVSWHRGDLPPLFPFGNHIACQSALYRSRLQPHEHAVPYFIEDPLPAHSEGRLLLRKKGSRPVVGFCGYAGVVWAKMAYTLYTSLRHNYRSRRGKEPWDVRPLLPATLIRARALRALASDDRVETRFDVRSRAFRLNDKSGDPVWRQARIHRFYDNLYDSDYALCIRGNGNWSIRFFEALAVGRIPVFVDTDCVLPDVGIDWRTFCVWVDDRDIRSLPARLLEFHESMTPGQFLEKQEECRRIWVDRLSRQGFMNYLAKSLRGGILA